MSGWNDVENAVYSATNSLGSAEVENQRFMSSIQGKVNQFNSEFQKLSANFIDSNLIKIIVDIGKGLLSLTNTLGVFNVAMLATVTILAVSGKFGTGVIGIASLIDKLVISLGMGTAAATTFSTAMSVIIPVAVLLVGISVVKQLSKEADKLIEVQKKIIETSNGNIKNYEQEIMTLASLQKSLNDAKGNKESLLAISSQLNSIISETPGLINGEADAYDLARQKLIDYRIELENKVKAEKAARLSAQRELYNTASVDNRFTLDRLPNAGTRIDLKEAVAALDLYNDFPDLASEELRAKLKTFVEEQVKIAQDIFADYINQSLPDVASRAAASNFVSELVYGGFNIDQIDTQLENLIPSIKEINNLKNELSAAKVSGTPTDEIISRFINLIDELKEKFPYMNDYFNTFTDNFVSVANGAKVTNDNFTDYNKLLETSKASVDKYAKSIKTVSSAFKEQEENGSLSLETTLSLIEAGYGAALVVDEETGKVRIEATTYRDLAKAKYEAELATLNLTKAEVEERDKKSNPFPYSWMPAPAPSQELSDINTQIALYKDLINNIDKVVAGTYGDSTTKTKSGNEDPYKDMVESKIEDLKYFYDMGKKTQEQYLNELDSINQKYYANQDKYVEEFRRINVEVYKGNLQLAEEASSAAEKAAEETAKAEEERQKKIVQALDARISAVEKLYKVHQNELLLIEQLTAINKASGITDEQKSSIVEKINQAYSDLADNRIHDIEHEIMLLERQENKQQEIIALYKKMQDVVHEEAERLRSKGFSDTSSEIQSLQNLWYSYADAITGILDDAYEATTQKLKNSLNEQADAIQSSIDDLQEEQNNLEKSLSYITNLVDSQIENLQREKEALEDNNSAIERQITLTKLQDSLESARKNRNVRTYSADKGWTWENDPVAIQSAQTALDDFNRTETLRQEQERIDSAIKKWQDYKDGWNSVTTAVESENSKILAQQIYGASIESDVLNQRASAVEEFGRRYRQTLADISAAQSELNSVTEQIKNVESGSSSGGSYSEKVAPIVYNSGTDYMAEMQKILQKMENATPEEKHSSSFATYMETLGALETRRNSKIRQEGLPYEQTSLYGGQKFASGTLSSPESSLSLVGELGPEFRVINRGDGILPANITKNLWSLGANPAAFVAKTIQGLAYATYNQSTNNGTTIRIEHISLPSVKNGNDFITELQLLANTR